MKIDEVPTYEPTLAQPTQQREYVTTLAIDQVRSGWALTPLNWYGFIFRWIRKQDAGKHYRS